jgi:hypothetical protein
MSDLEQQFLELKAQMEKAEQDRLWDHFVNTGQVLPTINETMKEINLLQHKINEIEKLMWTNPFPTY